jgi:hypothetical protein
VEASLHVGPSLSALGGLDNQRQAGNARLRDELLNGEIPATLAQPPTLN